MPRQASDYATAHLHFDSASLSQLGLTGMPGVPHVDAPGSGAEYHGNGGGYGSSSAMLNYLQHPSYPSCVVHSSVPQVQYIGGSLYPSVSDIGSSVRTGYLDRPVSPNSHDGFGEVSLSGPGRAPAVVLPVRTLSSPLPTFTRWLIR